VLAGELGPVHGPLVVFASETGLRPSEWLALERRDVRRDDGVVLVERTCSNGTVRPYGKTAGSRRRVPLSARAMSSLEDMPPRLDSRLLFPGPGAAYLNLHNWRARDWTPALEAAGLPHRSPYALRHTFAAHALAAGLGIFELARFMGTSLEQISATYGHLLPSSEDVARAKLDAHADRLCRLRDATEESQPQPQRRESRSGTAFPASRGAEI
jgi:integrase